MGLSNDDLMALIMAAVPGAAIAAVPVPTFRLGSVTETQSGDDPIVWVRVDGDALAATMLNASSVHRLRADTRVLVAFYPPHGVAVIGAVPVEEEFTPILTQNDTAVAATLTHADMNFTGSWVHVAVTLVATGAGTGNTPIAVQGVPMAHYSSSLACGTMIFTDATTGAAAVGVAVLSQPSTVTEIRGIRDGAAGGVPMGQSPNVALAAGDVVQIAASYHWA